MSDTIGFIGLGNMGAALAQVACTSLGGNEVLVANRSADKAQRFADAHGCTAVSANAQIARRCRIVVLAVVPSAIGRIIEEIAPALVSREETGEPPLVLSIAAGWTLDNLEEAFAQALPPWQPLKPPIVRCMPNMPITIGRGVTLFCRTPRVSDAQAEEMLSLFAPSGLCEFVSEDVLAAAIPVFSCSPAMAYMYIESLADAGSQLGLARDQAIRYAAHATLGAATLAAQGSKHIAALRDELAAPQGMTIAGTNTLETCGFRGAVIQGVLAAYAEQFTMDK